MIVSGEQWRDSTIHIHVSILPQTLFTSGWKRQRRTLNNDQGISPRRRYNDYKYIYTPNIGATKYASQILKTIKGKINSKAIIVGRFNTLHSSMDKSFRQKINKETYVLNDMLDEMGLIDIFRIFHPNAEYTFFSSAHGTF